MALVSGIWCVCVFVRSFARSFRVHQSESEFRSRGVLPEKISSEENREILGLLCKVHELEITNAELQSNSLLRENLLRQKDLEMNKYDSRQRLCDEIIQMQRSVINGKLTEIW